MLMARNGAMCVKDKFAQGGVRRIMKTSKRDTLILDESDFPKRHPMHLKLVAEKDYKREYEENVTEVFGKDDKTKRLIAVIPLYPKKQGLVRRVVPIPCILDTGVPKMLYLGRRAIKILDDLRCIQWGTYENRAIGNIRWNGIDIRKPDIETLPEAYEFLSDDDA